MEHISENGRGPSCIEEETKCSKRDSHNDSREPVDGNSGGNVVSNSDAIEFDQPCWDDVKPEENSTRRVVYGKAIPSLDSISLCGDRFAFSVSSLVGRYWSGMILLAESSGSSSDSKEMNIKSYLSVPTGVSDVQLFGDWNIFAGHDDGCVSLLCPDSEDAPDSTPGRLQIASYAVEHDSFVIRVGLNSTRDCGATLENDGRIKLWMIEPFISVNTFKAFPFRAFDLAFHPKRKGLLATCGDIHVTPGEGSGASAHNSLALWSISEKTTATVASSAGGVKCSDFGSAFTSVSWSPVDDDWLFAGDRAGNISLFDIRKLEEPVITIQSVHKSGPVERIVSDGPHVFSIGSDRCLAVREIFADEDGLARDRVAFGDGFKHSSAPRGLTVNSKGGVWTCENACKLWCHQLPGDESPKKLNSVECSFFPELKSLDF